MLENFDKNVDKVLGAIISIIFACWVICWLLPIRRWWQEWLASRSKEVKKICPECKTLNPLNANYCIKCGEDIESEEEL